MIYREEDLEGKVVFVNGKRIAADIQQVDTEKGTVVIYTPYLRNLNVVSAKDQTITEGKNATFEYVTRTLQGTVEVLDLAKPARN